MKKIIFLLATIIVLGSFFAQDVNSFSTESINLVKRSISNGKIVGTVKEAVSCVPNPLPDATVIAIKECYLFGFGNKYKDVTDENGEFELDVLTGTYRVFSYKRGYRQIYPNFWHIVTVSSGQELNCSFIMRSKFFVGFYSAGLTSCSG